jgi:hypothetical protein
MKYAAEKGSGAMIHIQSFVKTGTGIQMLMGEGGCGCTDAHTA